MLVVLVSDLGEGSTLLLAVQLVLGEIVLACVAEHLCHHGRLAYLMQRAHYLHVFLERIATVGKLRAERATLHFLKAQCQHALVSTALDCRFSQIESRRSGRAVIVHVHLHIHILII